MTQAFIIELIHVQTPFQIYSELEAATKLEDIYSSDYL